MLGKAHYPDPDIRYGHFRVLPRTDGMFIVYDERRPAANRTVKVFRTQKAAAEAAMNWHRLGHG